METMRVFKKLALYAILIILIYNLQGKTLIAYEGDYFNDYFKVDMTQVVYLMIVYLVLDIGIEVVKLKGNNNE